MFSLCWHILRLCPPRGYISATSALTSTLKTPRYATWPQSYIPSLLTHQKFKQETQFYLRSARPISDLMSAAVIDAADQFLLRLFFEADDPSVRSHWSIFINMIGGSFWLVEFGWSDSRQKRRWCCLYHARHARRSRNGTTIFSLQFALSVCSLH